MSVNPSAPLVPGALLEDSDGVDLVEMVKGLKLRVLAPQDVPLEPVGQRLVDLVADVLAGRHGEDVVELFERPLLGLGEEEEDEHERDDVEAGVEAEG